MPCKKLLKGDSVYIVLELACSLGVFIVDGTDRLNDAGCSNVGLFAAEHASWLASPRSSSETLCRIKRLHLQPFQLSARETSEISHVCGANVDNLPKLLAIHKPIVSQIQERLTDEEQSRGYGRNASEVNLSSKRPSLLCKRLVLFGGAWG